MNATIIDPLQGDFPEVIEEYLEHGVMKCVAFNRRGNLLAAGCSDGSCIIWDFETRVIVKEFKDKECVAAITSVCWSKYGHRILVSAADKTLILWDVVRGERIARTVLKQTSLHARLHPGSSTPSTCLACPLSSAPMIVDLLRETTIVLPVSLSDTGNGATPPLRNKFSDGSAPFTPTAACFNKYGDLVYVGNSKGEILIIDSTSIAIRAIVSVPGGTVIKNIVFDRSGQYLLTNSNDRIIRIYENLLPLKSGLAALDKASHEFAEQDQEEKLKSAGSRSLALFREFQDSITRVHWKAPCFSGDGEWVVGGSASKGEHKIYIWDRAGHLVKILEGPKEALVDLTWHPVKPVVVSVSLTGLVYIWAKDYTENWSAFAPDFKELEENEEYVEREDEFDLVPETEKVKDLGINEDEDIDILNTEGDSAFSDSDMSQDEIRFLPPDPCPDVPEMEDGLVVNTSKEGEISETESPFSEEAGQNGHLTNHESSPLEEDTGGMRLKRKRMPSEKFMDFETEDIKMPPSKSKP
ncbi:protein RBL-like [Salvia hispanica]|uniref:protein RBL-like n=1 Tax=Salvia hispanica TaxID=49212 RepID=UPI0020095417|nr:protein RBL-like [Salvia hispanica]